MHGPHFKIASLAAAIAWMAACGDNGSPIGSESGGERDEGTYAPGERAGTTRSEDSTGSRESTGTRPDGDRTGTTGMTGTPGTTGADGAGSGAPDDRAASAGGATRTMIVPVRSIEAGKLARNPEEYYGQLVTVSGEVERVGGRQALLLEDDRLFSGPDVAVITARDLEGVREGERVEVTGFVERMVIADMDRDYSWFDPSSVAELEVELEQRPVIVAASVRTEQGRELLSEEETPSKATPTEQPG